MKKLLWTLKIAFPQHSTNKEVKEIKTLRTRKGCMETQPVSMLSLTMHVPWVSTASQGMIIPLAGIMMTSPGTSSVDMACSISRNNTKKENTEKGVNNSIHLLQVYTCYSYSVA